MCIKGSLVETAKGVGLIKMKALKNYGFKKLFMLTVVNLIKKFLN
jgi:hypothetical protein